MFDWENIAKLIDYLESLDDYEQAMLHFMSMTEDSSLIEQSTTPPPEIVQKIVEIYGPAAPKINMAVGLEGLEVLSSIKFFYVATYDFVHGMFNQESVYGATIFFPELGKGAMSLIQKQESKTIFIRLTSISEKE